MKTLHILFTPILLVISTSLAQTCCRNIVRCRSHAQKMIRDGRCFCLLTEHTKAGNSYSCTCTVTYQWWSLETRFRSRVESRVLVKLLWFNNFLFVVFSGKKQSKHFGKMPESWKKFNLEVMAEFNSFGAAFIQQMRDGFRLFNI